MGFLSEGEREGERNETDSMWMMMMMMIMRGSSLRKNSQETK